MTGQEAVNVARRLQRIAFDGVVLTKLDGDTRGGAALSVRAVTGKPIKLVGTGEKLDQLETSIPTGWPRGSSAWATCVADRKAEAAVEEDEQAEMEARMRKGEDHVRRLPRRAAMLKKMGPARAC